jgi:hypothetical protein
VEFELAQLSSSRIHPTRRFAGDHPHTSMSIEFEQRKAGNFQFSLEKLGERCFVELCALLVVFFRMFCITESWAQLSVLE